jgi:hypothetical protein
LGREPRLQGCVPALLCGVRSPGCGRVTWLTSGGVQSPRRIPCAAAPPHAGQNRPPTLGLRPKAGLTRYAAERHRGRGANHPARSRMSVKPVPTADSCRRMCATVVA